MSGYDLGSLKLPRLKGLALRIFAAALDGTITRRLLLPSLLKQGGVDKLRALRLKEDPTLYPYTPAAVRARGPLAARQVDGALGRAASRPPFSSSRDYAAAYRAGKITPVEVAERVLAAIEESDRSPAALRAFIHTDRGDLLAQARASAGRIRRRKALSALDGVPVAIKDEIDQAPFASHGGTAFLGAAPARDSTAAARLRAAGALLIGKTNMYELGLDPSGFNGHFGTARNPYDPARDPGGSSSGSAAAVAAGLCPVALGCDGGGSIRIPASLCGLVGLKPTFGRVSSAGTVQLCPSLDAVGPIGASVEDAAIAYGLIAGPDPLDPRSQFQPPVELKGWNDADLRGLTLGIYRPWFGHAAPEVVRSCESAVDRLQAAGARVREIELQGLDAMRIAHAVTIISEQAAFMQDRREHYRKLSPPTRVTLVLARGFSASDFVQAQRVRTQAVATFQKAFESVDAILTPASAVTALPIPTGAEKDGWSDLSATTEKMRFAFAANLTGLPAISFPAGYAADGLPIGMQAIGRYWEERTLLRIAFAAERRSERRKPQVFYPILD
jgi:Asp-tRNA(Asn)/Glu-tRNA(Gln) amidotransferase A subunit family amidase